MASMIDIKRRIKSVKSTQQITKAMNLVAAAKLQRSKNRLESTRPFYEETRRVISNIIKSSEDITHPFIEKREAKNTGIIVITGDRGLCGGYNSNAIKKALSLGKENVSFITVGSKSTDFFIKEDAKFIKYYTGISEAPTYEDAAKVGKIVTDLYSKGELDEVFLVYTQFESTISHIPRAEKLLPIDITEFSHVSEESEEKGIKDLMIYEPNEKEVLSYVIPKYINTVIYGALAESAACEQGARMTSMDSATKSAYEAIDSMTILYNRARQGAITQEITEIVGGANALS